MKKQVTMVMFTTNGMKSKLNLTTAQIKGLCGTTLKELELDGYVQAELDESLKNIAKQMMVEAKEIEQILIMDDYAEESFEVTREDVEREERRADELEAEAQACEERDAEEQYVEQLEERLQLENELEAEKRAKVTNKKLYALSEEEYAEFLEWKREKEENQLYLEF